VETFVRYGIILIGIAYLIYKIKRFAIDKKYGCDTCNLKNTCNRKSCQFTELSKDDKLKIKEIKNKIKGEK